MLKLSSRTNYGVRALVDLALQTKNHPGRKLKKALDPKPVTMAAISARQGIPQAFLEQIFFHLRRAGLVSAVRGARGGYLFKQDPRQISIAHVVQALEGPIGPALCTMPDNFGTNCREGDCVSSLFCRQLDGNIRKVLNTTRISDLCQEASRRSSARRREKHTEAVQHRFLSPSSS